jgi:hypothetical protein
VGVDTTFQPKTPTYTVDSSAAVLIDGRQAGVTSWRIRALGATGAAAGISGFIKWAPGGTGNAPSAATAPVLGTPTPNQVGVNAGQTLYLEGMGGWLYFIGNAAYAASSFEVTGGQGGCGG